MENNEMICEEVMDSAVETIDLEPCCSKMGTGKAMLIGVGLTLAATAIVKLAKKAWADHKAKKEAQLMVDAAGAEVSDEDIAEITN